MRSLPVDHSGTPDIRSAGAFQLWLIRQQLGPVVLGMTWGSAWMVAQALVPAAIGWGVDALLARQPGRFAAACAVVLGLGLLTATAGILRHRCVVANFLCAAYLTIQLVTEQASRLGDTLARLVSAGEVISIGSSDVIDIGAAIDISGRGAGAVVALIVTTLILLSSSVSLGLIVLIGAPALTALTGLALRPLHHRQRGYRDEQGDLAASAADIVGGLRVLRGIGGEAVFARRYRAQSQRLRAAGIHVAGAESYLIAAQVFVPGLFVTAATWIAAHYALRRAITPGELVSFYAYASFLELPLLTLTEAADLVVRSLVACGRVIRLLALQPAVADPADPLAEPPAGADLHDPASGLTVRAGELLGVTADEPGAAAALADRLGRYGPAAGPDPELGGVPLGRLPVSVVRRRIMVASGQDQLFDGQLAEVVGGPVVGGPVVGGPVVGGPVVGGAVVGGAVGGAVVGGAASRDEDVRAALHSAAALDVAEAVPGGLRGAVAARGTSLSGGQAQRLRLARALLAGPEILILVEPTSAVDAHTEGLIAARLRAARAGQATVVVTSSPLLLGAADRVAYLRDGRVAAEGTHRGLLTASDGYAAAVRREVDA